MSEVVIAHTVILWKALQGLGRVCAFLGVGFGGEKPALFMDGFHRGYVGKGRKFPSKAGIRLRSSFVTAGKCTVLCQPVLGTKGVTVWESWGAALC